MSGFLLSSFSVMAVVMMMTATLFVVGLWRTTGKAAYKSWLITTLLGLIFWHGMGFLSGGLHPGLREVTYRYTNTLFNVGLILSEISFVQVVYLFPVAVHDRERQWALRIAAGIGVIYAASVIWFHFIQNQTGLSSTTYGPFVNAWAGAYSLLIQGWSLFVLLRKSQYFKRSNPSLRTPVLLLAASIVGLLGLAVLQTYPGPSYMWVLQCYSIGFWLLIQMQMLIYTTYSAFPIRFRDKLVGFTFASLMSLLSIIIMVVVPFTTNAIDYQNVSQRLIDQPILVRLICVALGSAAFVLLVFPAILKVSFMQPLQRLIAGIQRINQGDLTVQVLPGTLDEIGILTQHFNYMTQSLKYSKDELIEYAETLEQRVNERTAQLNQSLYELKSTQSQLIHKEKMASLGELTAGIAHEIQNPLNLVNNYSEVSVDLVSELKADAQAGRNEDVLSLADDLAKNLQKIHQHGDRASRIVQGMLEHSRTQSSERRLVNLNTLAEDYLKIGYQGYRANHTSFNCSLFTDFDSSIGQIELAPQEIVRVLLNLYNNAFYALHEQSRKKGQNNYNPTLRVSTRILKDNVDGHLVQLCIADNGVGIPESVKAKIFQPFFTTKPTGEGTGLGLSLSYDIITKGHGGVITVESERDSGTVFMISFP